MINEEIATIFENMSRALSFREASRYRTRASRKGGDRFRIMAYQRAALSLRDLKEDLETTSKEGRLKDITGIGTDLAAMIEEYIKTQRIRRYDRSTLKHVFCPFPPPFILYGRRNAQLITGTEVG